MNAVATRIVPIFETNDYLTEIESAARMLRDGKIVVLPTETVYGAAGVLRNADTRSRLRDLRASDKHNTSSAGNTKQPFVPHLADSEQARAFLGPVSALGDRMMRKLWPGPVTLIFDVPPERCREVCAELNVPENDLYQNGTITLRCPDDPIALDVIRRTGDAIAAVRAGLHSSQPATRASVVAKELDGKVDLVIDAGPPRYAKPSTILRVKNDSYELVRAGVYDARIIERLLRTTILFVCSGNTCRSPMAEAIARHVIAGKLSVPEADLEKKGISVMSAGASAMPGSRATPQAVEAVRGLGADLTHHRSKTLTVELIHQADAIYTMSRDHAHVVQSLVPSAARKVQTLAEGRDIDDPIGGDSALYIELAGELRKLIEDRLKETVLR